jgi:hypothetical protein
MLRGETLMTTDLGVACRHTASIATHIVNGYKANVALLKAQLEEESKPLHLYMNAKLSSPTKGGEIVKFPVDNQSSDDKTTTNPIAIIRKMSLEEGIGEEAEIQSAKARLTKRKGFSVSPPKANAAGLLAPPGLENNSPPETSSTSSYTSASSFEERAFTPSPVSSPSNSPHNSPKPQRKKIGEGVVTNPFFS